MYKIKLWDEDKWNIHSNSYNSSKYSSTLSDGKKDDRKYNEQKYGSKEKDIASDYIRKQDEKEKEDKDKTSIFEDFEEESNASERRDERARGELSHVTRSQLTEKLEMNEDNIPFKAARQVFNEKRYEIKKAERKKDINSIEDAIKKAIEEEKKLIVMDN